MSPLDDGFVSKGAAGGTMRGPLSVEPLLRATGDDQELVAVSIDPAFDDAGRQRVGHTALRVNGGSIVFGTEERPAAVTANGSLSVRGTTTALGDMTVTGGLSVSRGEIDPGAAPALTLRIGDRFGFAQGTSPDAGFLRFGDRSGWKFHIARAQEEVDGPLNTGAQGVLATITDNGDLGIGAPDPIARLHFVARPDSERNFIAFSAIPIHGERDHLRRAYDILTDMSTPNNTLLIGAVSDDNIQFYWKNRGGMLCAAGLATDAELTRRLENS